MGSGEGVLDRSMTTDLGGEVTGVSVLFYGRQSLSSRTGRKGKHAAD